MADARFSVELTPREGGCGPRGADHVELEISSAAGLPAGPLREIASGGELSRVMLALLSVAHSAAGDAGARASCSSSTRSTPASAATPPARSASTCASSPTVARCSASRTCRRSPRSGRGTSRSSRTRVTPARTTVTPLQGDEVVGELVRMLGADDGDKAASRHAKELLRAA